MPFLPPNQQRESTEGLISDGQIQSTVLFKSQLMIDFWRFDLTAEWELICHN